MYYSGWFEPFQAGFATTAAKKARCRSCRWTRRRISIAAIAHDQYDGYLSAYAEAVRAYGHPVILSFGHEMNGVVVRLGLHAHIAGGFRGRLATYRHRVPRAGSRQRDLAVDGQHRQQYAERQDPFPGPWWPGNAYVNWVGIDGYYLKPSWQFAPLFGPTIGAVRALTNDPILVAETGATAAAGQPTKIDDLFAGFRLYGLLGLVWFDATDHQGQDFSISSPAAIAAFHKAPALTTRPGS